MMWVGIALGCAKQSDPNKNKEKEYEPLPNRPGVDCRAPMSTPTSIAVVTTLNAENLPETAPTKSARQCHYYLRTSRPYRWLAAGQLKS